MARLAAEIFWRGGLWQAGIRLAAGIGGFFRAPTRPDVVAYRDYRQYLLETSQVPGGYYTARSRRQLLRKVVDMMLADCDPYDALAQQTAAQAQQLHLVH